MDRHSLWFVHLSSWTDTPPFSFIFPPTAHNLMLCQLGKACTEVVTLRIKRIPEEGFVGFGKGFANHFDHDVTTTRQSANRQALVLVPLFRAEASSDHCRCQ